MNRNKYLLLGVGAVGVFALGWYLTNQNASNSSSSASSSNTAQNAVDPNAQVGTTGAQGTMPDFGNLLSYNQVVGSTVLTPQATSVTSGVTGDTGTTTAGASS